MNRNSATRSMEAATWVSIIAMLQFALAVTLSVLCYSGKFQFTRQYLSELGCGGDFRALVFNLSLFTLGCGLAWFFGIFARHTHHGNARLPIVGVCGTMASLSLAAVGAIPMDFHEPLHVLAMISWLFFMLPMSAAWISWLTWQRYSIGWMLLNKLFVFAIALYLPASMIGLAPMWQKVVVLVSLLWMSTLCAEIVVILRRDGFNRLQRKQVAEIVRESNAVALARMTHRRKTR